jgi:hypothetical protein
MERGQGDRKRQAMKWEGGKMKETRKNKMKRKTNTVAMLRSNYSSKCLLRFL